MKDPLSKSIDTAASFFGKKKPAKTPGKASSKAGKKKAKKPPKAATGMVSAVPEIEQALSKLNAAKKITVAGRVQVLRSMNYAKNWARNGRVSAPASSRSSTARSANTLAERICTGAFPSTPIFCCSAPCRRLKRRFSAP